MKKCVIVCWLLFLSVLMLPVSVQADVIYEPYDDFFFAHRGECKYTNREFTAAGPNGMVTLYVDPLNPAEEKVYPNGTIFTVSYVYDASDGVQWGCCDMWQDEVTGWAPMEYLEMIYDGISFEEDYGDCFVQTQASLDAATITDGSVCFWKYPGSEETIAVKAGEDYLPEYYNIYTDADGIRWGQCGYYFGIKNHWINLDNPSADYETLYPAAQEETVPAPTQVPATEQVEEIKPEGEKIKPALIIAVASVVIVTALLLVLMKKKRA